MVEEVSVGSSHPPSAEGTERRAGFIGTHSLWGGVQRAGPLRREPQPADAVTSEGPSEVDSGSMREREKLEPATTVVSLTRMDSSPPAPAFLASSGTRCQQSGAWTALAKLKGSLQGNSNLRISTLHLFGSLASISWTQNFFLSYPTSSSQLCLSKISMTLQRLLTAFPLFWSELRCLTWIITTASQGDSFTFSRVNSPHRSHHGCIT